MSIRSHFTGMNRSSPVNHTERYIMHRPLCLSLIAAVVALSAHSGMLTPRQAFTLANSRISCRVTLERGHLSGDRVDLLGGKKDRFTLQGVETDAGFTLDIMWSDWRPPGKKNNAENPVSLTAGDFTFDRADSGSAGRGEKDLNLYFRGPERVLQVRVTYRLGAGDFYVRRNVSVMDSAGAGHLLRMLWGRDCVLRGTPAVVHRGGFGQPAAFTYGKCPGAFFGLEYPASQNDVVAEGRTFRLRCGQEMGEKIGPDWVAGMWVVECVTPDTSMKKWFWKYVDDIRVAPLRPYTLYNSWYDLRSPEFRNIPPGNVMNEENIMRIIGLIRRNMISKHGITLDAFVLDDGWDVYASDWVLRHEQFPHGLKPIADELRKTNTDLGLWLGPTGGYSFHPQRMAWMKAHGYETVDDQLCLAGTKYSALFRKRVEDFVRNDGVAYFKWDGIQFACNEPDHGHPIDIYSRRAVLESVIDKCNAVRSANPKTFLNITSGTWLSPWWLKYANQIWMDGQDYGYADVPSISPRDAAITYRDFVLYEDFRIKDLWFPVANMMTHGIIKGNLEKLGGEHEPLDKFTNEALLYFARGVSMWELYISPDILSEGEWNAMAQSMQWAKDRFPVLSTTTMIGGDPKARQSYGYVHFRGDEGVIAARNPSIEPADLNVRLDASLGLDEYADSLVLERVYPSHWISPDLSKAGATVALPLDGYETAIYEIYPLRVATLPLVAGVVFDPVNVDGNTCRISCYPPAGRNVRILNPGIIASIHVGGKSMDPGRFTFGGTLAPPPVRRTGSRAVKGGDRWEVSLRIDSTSHNAMLAVLLKPAKGEESAARPAVTMILDGTKAQPDVQSQKGMWAWYTLSLTPGNHTLSLTVAPDEKVRSWKGKATGYLICDQALPAEYASIEMKASPRERPMPPRPTAPGTFRVNRRLGEADLSVAGGK
jgi:hypothetical protein